MRDLAFSVSRQTCATFAPFTRRAPEILLGETTYSTAVDVWSVGCIFGELILKEPIFQAKGEIELLAMIFKLLGPPSSSSWPDYHKLPLAKTLSLPSPQPAQFRQRFPHLTALGIDLISSMLTYDPDKRISAAEALQHPYFKLVNLAPFRSIIVKEFHQESRQCRNILIYSVHSRPSQREKSKKLSVYVFRKCMN